MTLPLTESGLIGTCLAASALGVLVLTGMGGGQSPEAPAQTPASEAPAEGDSPAGAPAAPVEDAALAPDAVDPAFGDKVRRYLMANPGVIFEAVAEFERRNAAAQADMDDELIAANADALFDDPRAYVGGNPGGDVTLVEFLDYKCGFCKRAAPEVADFVASDGDVRLIVKEFPILGAESERAARFAISVLQLEGDSAYKTVHDRLMAHDGTIDRAYLDSLAAELALPMDAIAARMDSDAVSTLIADNRALGQRLQVSGTPTFVLDEQMIRGFVPATELAQAASVARE